MSEAPPLTVAEAFEAAIARGDLPEHWSDPERAPRWWCKRCHGRGVYSVARPEAAELFAGEMVAVCHACSVYPRTPGHTPLPPDLATLDAVAAFGAERLVTIERLAGVAEPGSSVVWRAMSRRALYLLSVEARRGTWAAVCGLLASGASDTVAFPFGASSRLREAARALVAAGAFVVEGAGTRMTVTLAVVRPDTAAERAESQATARWLLGLP